MKSYLVVLLACSLSALTSAVPTNAQITRTITSLYALLDPRSIAMGESSVSDAGQSGAWNSNPAVIATATGAGAQTAMREIPIGFGDNLRIYHVGGWAATALGSFALNYTMFDLGTFQQTFENGQAASDVHSYDYTLALTYARAIGPVSLGATVKRFANRMSNVVTDTTTTGRQVSSNGFWFDIGAICSAEDIVSSGALHDRLSAGISAQNLGGDLQYPELGQSEAVGQWVRVGASYELSHATREEGEILRARAGVEYQRLINPASLLYRENRVDQWGLGVEATVYDLLSLRLGTVAPSRSSIYGNAGSPALRYGLGLNLPLSRVGSELPLTIGLDYSIIELSADAPTASNPGVLGLHLAYTNALFN